MADRTGDELAQDVSLVDETGGSRATIKTASTASAAADPSLVVGLSPNSPVPAYSNTSGFSPDPNWTPAAPTAGGTVPPTIGPRGELAVRGPVFTDEGSFKDDFLDAALVYTSTGTATFTNGSKEVTGTGFLTVESLNKQFFVKASAHANSAFSQVARINSDTSLTLASAYTGVTATSTFSKSFWVPTSNIASPSLTVANSLLTITGDTTSGNYSGVSRTVDYSPLLLTFYASVSQRIANQYAFVGYGGFPGSTFAAFVRWQGTSAAYAELVTSTDGSAASTQVTQFAIPLRHTSADTIEYILDIQRNEVCLFADGIDVARHKNHVQGPYDTMTMGAGVVNTGVPASATSLVLDSMLVENINFVNVIKNDNQNTDPEGNMVVSTYGNHGPFFTNFTNSPLNPTLWDVYNTGGTFAVSNSNLVITNPASANVNDMIVSKMGFRYNPYWSLHNLVEGTRVANSGFVVSFIKIHPSLTPGSEHSVHQVAVGLNADPVTGAALAAPDGNMVIRVAFRTASGWSAVSVIDIANTSADPFFTNVQTAWELEFVQSAGMVNVGVNDVVVFTCHDVDMNTEFGLMVNAATNATAPLSTASLTIGSIQGLEQTEVLVRGNVPLRTLTENADIPEARILGVRGQMFIATTGNINLPSSGVETPLLLIRNTSTTKSIYIDSLVFDTVTATRSCNFRWYHTPTITGNGTTITPVNRRIGSAITSTVSLSYSPTVSANGTQLSAISVSQGNSYTEHLQLATSLKPGYNLLVTGSPSANNVVVSTTIRFAEL